MVFVLLAVGFGVLLAVTCFGATASGTASSTTAGFAVGNSTAITTMVHSGSDGKGILDCGDGDLGSSSCCCSWEDFPFDFTFADLACGFSDFVVDSPIFDSPLRFHHSSFPSENCNDFCCLSSITSSSLMGPPRQISTATTDSDSMTTNAYKY